MSSAFEFLKENRVFHVATSDGSKGRVRPFGFVMERNNALYFFTAKTKDVYKQMKQNPDIEIEAIAPDMTVWLRVRGRIAFDDSRDAKAQVFAESPEAIKIYPKGPDDENTVTFYFTEAEATLYSFSGPPSRISLL